MKRIRLALPSPYVGLRPFFESEALLFFGRDAHVGELLAKLQRRQRFLAVLGASGTGKSSLVRAGLIPALRRGALAQSERDVPGAGDIDRWNVSVFTPGDAPLARLAHALTDDERWCDGPDRRLAEASLASLLGASPLALTTLYRQKADRFEHEALLLVVDQFEEIFRYRQRNPDEADGFVKLLLRSASEDVPIYVAMTMRSDFLGHAVAIHGLAEAINSGIYLTPRLGTEQIRSVVASPLSLVGGSIDPVLANRLLNTLSGEDELPVLEHALLRMWDRAKAAGRSSIEAEDYAAICGAPDGGAPALPLAIDNHASEIFDALTPQQQNVARQCFLALVERRDGRDTRRPQALRELRALVGDEDGNALLAVLDAYRAPGVGFLLPPARRALDDDALIDISHESLIRRWRRLQAWLDEEATDVTGLIEWKQRAQLHVSGGGLLDESDLARAGSWRARVVDRGRPEQWAASHAGRGAFGLVDDYLQKSRAELDRIQLEREALRSAAEEARVQRLEAEARLQRELAEHALADQIKAERETSNALANNRTIRRRGKFVAALGLLATVAFIGAVVSYRQAERAAADARALASKAQASELARTAESLSKDLPDTSVLLALEARRLDPGAPLANALIRSAQAAFPYRLVLRGAREGLLGAAFSADGRSVLTASREGPATVWNAADGGVRAKLVPASGGPLTAALFSPDGLHVLTTSEDRTALLWDAAGGKLLHTLRGHEKKVTGGRFSPDGRLVATYSDDGTAQLWNVDDGRALAALRGHGDAITSLRFSADGRTVLTASADQTARLWNAADGKALRVLSGHTYAVLSAEFSPDGQRIVTASQDRTARLWGTARGSYLRELSGHSDAVTSASFSADGASVLTAGDDGQARLWDASSGDVLQILKGHEGKVRSAIFSADGKTVLTAGADKSVRLWDAASGDELRMLAGHEGALVEAVFSPDAHSVLTAGEDGTARLWNLDDDALVGSLNGHDEALVSAVFDRDGSRVLTASADHTARLWSVVDAKPMTILQGHQGLVTTALFLPDGKLVLTASQDNTARLWSAADGRLLQALQGHTGQVTAARFSGDGKTVLTSSDDNTARLWDVASGQQLRVLEGHNNAVSAAHWSADGKLLLTAGWDNTARLWNAADGKTLHQLSGHTGPVASARLSKQGDRVLTASWDGTAILWNVSNGKALVRLQGHTDRLNDALFSPRGDLAVSISDDRTARLWELPGRYLRTLVGHEGPLKSGQWSPDGRTLLTASVDGTARLWDVASGKQLRVLRGHAAGVAMARFSSDGTQIVTASEDKTARLWRCRECRSIEVLADEAAQRIGRELSPDERTRYLTLARERPE